VASLDYARRFARGAASINCSAGGTVTPSDIEAANPVLNLTGTPAAAFVLAVPSEAADWMVLNSTAQSVTVKTAGQTGGYVISSGRYALIFTDGTVARSAPGETRGQDLRDTPTSDTPDASAASRETVNAAWVRQLLAGQSFYSTGDFKLTFKSTPDAGWLFLAGGSIGSAASGATTRANADTAALYSLFWNNLGNGEAPVAGGRGGSAASDFAANKALTMPDFRGRAPIGAGQGPGLSPRYLGSLYGAEAVSLSIAQMPQHDHGGATSMVGDHSHGADTLGNGYHGHYAWTGGAGAHGHAASSDTQGEHNHQIGSEALYNGYGGGVYIGDRTYPGGNFPSYQWQNTSTAGNHAHNINVGAVGDHSHGVGIEAGGQHAHEVRIFGAGNHQHSLSAQGSSSGHDNMQPSLAVNVMIKL
jgi:microcystin-dependent protein